MASLVPPSSRGKALGDSDSVIRSLLALPELRMRTLWLEGRIFSEPMARVAPILNEVAERAQSTDKRAREAMIALALLLAQKRHSSLIWALREAARIGALLGLERLVREGTEANVPDVELELRVPDYGGGRELSVGERRSLARRPSRLQIDRLLLDPHPLVLRQLLACPTITEDDVLRLVTRRPARLVALELLVEAPRWMARRRVRASLILNPGTPHGIALPLVSTCPRDDLRLVIGTTNLSLTLRTVAHELYVKLPPVSASLEHRSHQ